MADKKQPKIKRKVGAPTKYNLVMATRICEAIATSTDSYLKIHAANPDFPDRTNMRLWRYRHPEFRHMYDQAKRDQAELLAEEIQEIADYTALDTKINFKTGEVSADTEWIARSRLRVDTRKWIACKLLPKVYGDKTFEDTTKHAENIQSIADALATLNKQNERDY